MFMGTTGGFVPQFFSPSLLCWHDRVGGVSLPFNYLVLPCSKSSKKNENMFFFPRNSNLIYLLWQVVSEFLWRRGPWSNRWIRRRVAPEKDCSASNQCPQIPQGTVNSQGDLGTQPLFPYTILNQMDLTFLFLFLKNIRNSMRSAWLEKENSVQCTNALTGLMDAPMPSRKVWCQ